MLLSPLIVRGLLLGNDAFADDDIDGVVVKPVTVEAISTDNIIVLLVVIVDILGGLMLDGVFRNLCDLNRTQLIKLVGRMYSFSEYGQGTSERTNYWMRKEANRAKKKRKEVRSSKINHASVVGFANQARKQPEQKQQKNSAPSNTKSWSGTKVNQTPTGISHPDHRLTQYV